MLLQRSVANIRVSGLKDKKKMLRNVVFIRDLKLNSKENVNYE